MKPELSASEYKDLIQELLLTQQLTFVEIRLHFKLDKQQLNNYLTSLRFKNLINYVQKDIDANIRFKRYFAYADMPKYTETVTQALKEKIEKAKLGYGNGDFERQATINGARIIRLETDPDLRKKVHQAMSMHRKANTYEWRGYNSMAGV